MLGPPCDCQYSRKGLNINTWGAGKWAICLGLPTIVFKTAMLVNGHLSPLRERPPWVDSACTDCPGFLVPGGAGAPASSF